MPGAMHRMGVYLGLVEDDDYAGDYAGEYGDGELEYAGDRSSSRRGPDDAAGAGGYAEARYSRETHHGRAAEARGREHAAFASDYAEVEQYANTHGRGPAQITTLHPRTYNEARTIGEHFRSNTPVIMNLSDMDDADAKRLVDFAAGLIFGLHGSIDRVTTKVFLLTPRNVTVTAEDKARMAENGFFNQS